MNTSKKSEKWIALVHVKPTGKETILGSSNGAYLTIIYYAGSMADAKIGIKASLSKLELDANKIEDLELLSNRLRKYEVSKDLLERSKKLSNKNPIVLGTINAYL